MSLESVCPQCGAPLSPTSGASKIPMGGEGASPVEEEDEAPPIELLASGSHDDNFLADPARLASEPDPILGSFVTPTTNDRASTGISSPRSSATFAILNLEVPGRTGLVSGELRAPSTEELPDRRTSWNSILLTSYASAITLALAWTLWTTRSSDREEAGRGSETIEGVTRGRQAHLSRKAAPLEPVIGEHELELKQSLVVGSLKVTPLEVTREEVWLQKTGPGSEGEIREGGENAWVLRVRLGNLSENLEFAPLDPAFIREQEKVLVDTFLQTSSGQRIYPYPLAIESEWSIFGQDFSALRPHESRVVSIVSASEAPEPDTGVYTWRVRLRTGLDRTDVLAIRWTEP